MTITIGIDVGSTYTKSIALDEKGNILAKDARHTGFKLDVVSEDSWRACIEMAKLTEADIDYTVSTGIGRHLCPVKDIFVTDLTASSRGATRLFPGTRRLGSCSTILVLNNDCDLQLAQTPLNPSKT